MVTVLTGRTVSLSSNITTFGLDVTISSGGFLDLSSFQFSNGLLALRGQGTLKLGSTVSDNFPNPVTTNTFVNVGGGTTEYDASVNIIQATHNNLTINTAGTVIYKNSLSPLTQNGNLFVKQGTFQINDNTAQRLQIIVNGNVTVNSGAAISVGTGVTNSTTDPTSISGGTGPFTNYYDGQSHRIVIMGDFINNGTVRFTNLANPVYNAFPSTINGATTGFATVYFQCSTNNVLTCNGPTDFYNMVLDKGSSQTFALTVYSSTFSNFRLFGANNATIESSVANPNVRKALWIRNGTLNLTGLIVIPSLTEGNSAAAPSSDYFIPSNGAMILDGPFVAVLSTADDYTEVNAAYGLSAPDNATYQINTSGAEAGFQFLANFR